MRVSEQVKASTRVRLVESAADAFAQHGLTAANINSISVAAGCAKGTVYNYFPSKESLFAAVVEEACRRAVEGAQDPGSGAPVAERLRALAASDVRWAQEHEAFAKVLVQEVFSCSPSRNERVVAAAAPYADAIAQVLDEAASAGEILPSRPTGELALIFAGIGLMALAQHWGSGGVWPAAESIPDLAVDAFLAGLAPSVEHPAAPRRRQRT